MKNLDLLANAKAQFAQNFKDAFESKDETKMTNALNVCGEHSAVHYFRCTRNW